MIEVKGKGCVVKVVSHSINENLYKKEPKEIITFHLQYPRLIHQELLTHKMFSRNSSSSRAIPVSTMLKQIWSNPATPIYWGSNKSGMQAGKELSGIRLWLAKNLWNLSAKSATTFCYLLGKAGLHKQHANRPGDNYQIINTVLTATEYENWYWLRDHDDAQPEIKDLAQTMKLAASMSKPVSLKIGEWHLPFVKCTRLDDGVMHYFDGEGKEITLREALKISAACCASISYRKTDATLQAAERIWDKLVTSQPVHGSPTEHQATPMCSEHYGSWHCGRPLPGISHMDRNGKLWSANFQSWIQHRKLIPNEAKW